ncbi:hypothetical protein X777_04281 [Ooceraea biroi]|uniref:Uncharacterized protein n=1 Tax=Ooceraea biroi TaxID=2015173 RepID=A0A026WHF0_OOCBI|nr:hypothetical protein X777_04281 [Ooceraea biroi]
MATEAHQGARQLARAAFARSLEWENQPAGRRLVARPAGTSRRTIVAARGTYRHRLAFSACLLDTPVPLTARENHASGCLAFPKNPAAKKCRARTTPEIGTPVRNVILAIFSGRGRSIRRCLTGVRSESAEAVERRELNKERRNRGAVGGAKRKFKGDR